MMSWFNEHVLRPEIAGAAGAVVGLIYTPGNTLRERAFNLIAGISVAWFVAPGVDDYFNITTKNGQMAVAFVVGLVGMNIVAKFIDYVKKSSFSDLWAWRKGATPPTTNKESNE